MVLPLETSLVRPYARFARPVTEIELLMLAFLALVPVVVLLFAAQLALSMSFRRRTGRANVVSRNAASPP